MSTAFQSTAFQNNAFQIDGGPVPVVVVDTHDGDHHRKKKWDAERIKREERRNDLLAAFDRLVEEKPVVAAQIVAPFTEAGGIDLSTEAPVRMQVDWSAVLDHKSAVDRLWQAFLDMDDEDVLLLI